MEGAWDTPDDIRVKVPNVGIRLADEDDLRFLFRRFMYDLRQVMPWRQMPRSLFFSYMHRRLEHHFTRAVVRVAYPEAWEENGKVYSGNPRFILGYIIADPTVSDSVGLVVHYVYTRRDYTPKGGQVTACYRRQGIARKLVEGMLKDYDCEHITYTVWGQEMFDDYFFDKVNVDWKYKMTYNPELFLSTLLPYQWERGVVATLDPEKAKVLHRLQALSPVNIE